MCDFCDPENMKHLAVSENSSSWVICNRYPIHPSLGHFLIVPKKHYIKLSEFKLAEKLDLFFLMADFTEKIEEQLKPERLEVRFNQGKSVGQSMAHFHVHILCREPGDGIINYHRGNRPEISEEALNRFKIILK
jgi:diadenosine tetraphosphate (Ap4A) HIT family hydrolase